MTIENKKIAMIIAHQDFRDEELFIPRNIFLNEGGEVKIVSSKKEEALGSFGGVTDVDLTLEELNVADYDAIIFVGGSGAFNYIENNIVHKIIKEAVSKKKLLGAICIAPAILAKSGVLKGKRATVWSNKMDKSAVKILKENGAKYENKAVVSDRRIVTANGPSYARQFAERIIELLTN